jgi:hypothetical protein
MTASFGPGWGNYAIRGIVEIELPDPVSLLPQTPGWWALLALACALLLRWGWRRLRRWQHNRYRREALSSLGRLETRFSAGDTSVLLELAPLLRATAVHASSRQAIASASGDDWAQAIANLAPDLPPLPLDQLQALAYAPPGAASPRDSLLLFEQLRRWIETHENCHA